MTVDTGVFYGFTLAVTMGTGLLYREKALLNTYLTITATGGTGYRLTAFFGTGTGTGFTTHQGGDFDLYGGAGNGIFQAQLHIVTKIRSTIGTSDHHDRHHRHQRYRRNITKNVTEIGAAAKTTAPAAAEGSTPAWPY